MRLHGRHALFYGPAAAAALEAQQHFRGGYAGTAVYIYIR